MNLLPTPCASDATGGGTANNREGHTAQIIDAVLDAELKSGWGQYMAAIRRWEGLTRQAPAPTEPNRNGAPRLSARFSEWMMGWPAGWVTGLITTDRKLYSQGMISRTSAMKMIGNGVVPQQAAAAIEEMWSTW
jgi:hypothetical protein